MAAIELGAIDLELSEADQHFNSSHGPNCGGWDNGTSLDSIQSRGVSTDATLAPANTRSTPPPVGDPNEPNPPNPNLWLAHMRNEANRANRTYGIAAYTGWSGNDRKTYLANVGPLVCGFTVYDDFQQYGGGVYHQTWGNVEGGHAVMVIGYDDNEQCWICRNSWGTGFGGAAHGDGTGAGFFKIGYGQCGIDGEEFFGCHGVIPPATLPLVTGISRSTDKLDVFCDGTDHATYTAAWQRGRHRTGRAGGDIQGGVSAPSTSGHPRRVPQHRQAGRILRGNRPRNVHRRLATGRQDLGRLVADPERERGPRHVDHRRDPQRRPPGHLRRGHRQRRVHRRLAARRHHLAGLVAGSRNLTVAAPNTSVFGVSRSADKLDIFAVGQDHGIYTAAWQPGDATWLGWWRVQGGVAAPNTSVTAVSRSADKLDIFAVGTDHGIYTAAWQPGDATWKGWWRVQGGVAAPNTSVFGASRSADKLDIFAVGTDHGGKTAAWQLGDANTGRGGGGSRTARRRRPHQCSRCRVAPTSWTSSPSARTIAS